MAFDELREPAIELGQRGIGHVVEVITAIALRRMPIPNGKRVDWVNLRKVVLVIRSEARHHECWRLQ